MITDKRGFSAWGGSILFHLLILLLFLLYLKLQPLPPAAPERLATGGIVLMETVQEGDSPVDSDNSQTGEASPVIGEDEPVTMPTLDAAPAGEPSEDRDIKEMLPDSLLGPRADALSAVGVPGAATQAESLQGGSRKPGFGTEIGGKALVRFFGTEAKGSSFVYVLDRSDSMSVQGSKPIRQAKAELIKSLEVLGNFHKFNIIVYNEDTLIWQPRKMVFATEIEKRSASRFVEGIFPMGGTRHREPLAEAIRLRPDVIFFLTDGDPNDDLKAQQLLDISRLNANIGAGAQINVIQFAYGTSQESDFLRGLANQNRGQYVYINVDRLH